jgi:hypothetical protein
MRRGAGQVWVQPPQAQRAALIHAKHDGTFVDEVLSGARAAAQLTVGTLGMALAFRPSVSCLVSPSPA